MTKEEIVTLFKKTNIWIKAEKALVDSNNQKLNEEEIHCLIELQMKLFAMRNIWNISLDYKKLKSITDETKLTIEQEQSIRLDFNNNLKELGLYNIDFEAII